MHVYKYKVQGQPLDSQSQLHFLISIITVYSKGKKKTPSAWESPIFHNQLVMKRPTHELGPRMGGDRRVRRIESRTHRRGEATNQDVRTAVPAATATIRPFMRVKGCHRAKQPGE